MTNVKEFVLFVKTEGTNLCNITARVFLEKPGREEKMNGMNIDTQNLTNVGRTER